MAFFAQSSWRVTEDHRRLVILKISALQWLEKLALLSSRLSQHLKNVTQPHLLSACQRLSTRRFFHQEKSFHSLGGVTRTWDFQPFLGTPLLNLYSRPAKPIQPHKFLCLEGGRMLECLYTCVRKPSRTSAPPWPAAHLGVKTSFLSKLLWQSRDIWSLLHTFWKADQIFGLCHAIWSNEYAQVLAAFSSFSRVWVDRCWAS